MNLFLPKKGDRIKLINMADDPNPVEPGTLGTVDFVDDIGQIHVKWDNGRSLALINGVDTYKIISDNNNIKTFEQFTMVLETGEWPRFATLDYLEENPEEVEYDEFLGWIQDMKNNMEQIISMVNDDVDISIYNIHGFDAYQGPYGVFDINDDKYQIWYAGHPEFFIENFPINKMNEDEHPGIKGDVYRLARAINIVFSDEKFRKINDMD